MSLGNKCLDKTVLEELLGADGVSELKTRLINIIVDQVREDLKQSDYYIISPNDISDDLYKDIINEVKDQVRKEYKDKIMNSVNTLFSNLG